MAGGTKRRCLLLAVGGTAVLLGGGAAVRYDRDIQAGWDDDRAAFIATADAKWPGLKRRLLERAGS